MNVNKLNPKNLSPHYQHIDFSFFFLCSLNGFCATTAAPSPTEVIEHKTTSSISSISSISSTSATTPSSATDLPKGQIYTKGLGLSAVRFTPGQSGALRRTGKKIGCKRSIQINQIEMPPGSLLLIFICKRAMI